MKRTYSFALFLTLFAAIYFGMHYYVLSKLMESFGKQIQPGHIALIFLLVFLFPLSAFLERTAPSLFSKVLYLLSSEWLGIVFIAFSVTLAAVLLSSVFPAESALITKAGLLLSLALSAYATFNASKINSEEVVVPLRGLKRPLSIAHLSDLHLGTVHEKRYLSRAVGITNSLNPDIVVITGDLIDSSRHLSGKDLEPLNRITAKAFYVTGNHENYYGLEEVFGLLRNTKLRVLRNEKEDCLGLQVIGVSHPPDDSRTNREISRMRISKKKPAVLLYHAPVGLEDASRAGVDLQLSGHTHAGQVFPFNLVVKMFYKVSSGFGEHKGMKIYVSPGTGTWGPPMRLGSKNTVTLIRLVPEE